MRIKKNIFIILIIVFTIITIGVIEFFKPIPKVQYVMYLSQPKYGTLSEEYYLIKLRHQFNEENLYSVFSISMRNHNSKNIDTILLIAQKNKFPQEKLLPYIMLYGTQYQWTKDMIVILNSIKPQNKYAKKIFLITIAHITCFLMILH